MCPIHIVSANKLQTLNDAAGFCGIPEKINFTEPLWIHIK